MNNERSNGKANRRRGSQRRNLEPDGNPCVRVEREVRRVNGGSMIYRIRCCECKWTGISDDALIAQNPFSEDPSDTISGCPQCKAIDQMERLCDEPGCFEPITMGTPTVDGYRETCRKHAPNA